LKAKLESLVFKFEELKPGTFNTGRTDFNLHRHGAQVGQGESLVPLCTTATRGASSINTARISKVVDRTGTALGA
jgi:hypothetical protein